MGKSWSDSLVAADTLQMVLHRIQADPRYVEGLTYGVPRPGHDEGSVVNHIAKLERTVDKLAPMLSAEEYYKMLILVHVHDAFKLEGKRRTGHRVSLLHPDSHASLAARFLAKYVNDLSLVSIVQYHDEGFALWQKFQKQGCLDEKRLQEHVLSKIMDMNLYLLFTVVDSFTESKMKTHSPRWFVDMVNQHVHTPRVYEAMALLGI